MPFVKIYHDTELSNNETRLISDCIHEALKKHFDIPEKDKFHLFLNDSPQDFIYDKEYLLSKGLVRTSPPLYIDILCGDGRTANQKRELFYQIAQSISQMSTIKIEHIFITLKETSRDNWSFGEGLAQLSKGEK